MVEILDPLFSRFCTDKGEGGYPVLNSNLPDLGSRSAHPNVERHDVRMGHPPVFLRSYLQLSLTIFTSVTFI
jgi:hypothetical protein